MDAAPLPENESLRQATLRRYQILNTPPEAEYDSLTRLAALVAGVPVAAITLLDDDRPWVKSRFCRDDSVPLPREGTFCALAVDQDDILVIPDTLGDQRVAASVAVVADPFIRFYAGVPLIAPNAARLGTLCLLDQKPQSLTADQVDALRTIAAQIIARLELRLQRSGLPLPPADPPTEIEALRARLAAEVAERKAVERQLFFQANMYQNVSDAVIAFDSDFTVQSWNHGAEALYGISGDEILGRNVADFIDTTYDGAPREEIWQTFQTVGTWSGRARQTLRGDGRVLNVTAFLSQILDAEGSAAGIAAVYRDVTDERFAQSALAESERQFRRLAENLPEYIYILDLGSLKTRYANKSSFLGFGRDEWQSTALLDLVHEEDLAEVSDYFQRFADRLLRGNPEVTYRLKSKYGSWEWIRQRGTIFGRDDAGEINQAMVTVELITEQRELEDEIQRLLLRRGRQVDLIGQIAQEIVTAPELSTLYRRLVNAVKEQFDYYHVQLLRYDSAQDAIALVYGYGEIGQKMLMLNHSMPMGIGLIGQAAATGRSMLRPVLADDPGWQPNPLLPETRGEMAIPIRFQDEVLGVLDVHTSRPGQLTEEDRLVLEGLCHQVAIAVDSTRLRQEMSEQLREMEHLQRLMSREGWRAVRQAGEVTGYHYDRADVRPLNGAIEPVSANDADEPLEADVSAETLESSQMLYSREIAIRGEVIGRIGIHDDPTNPLSFEDHELLESVAGQVAAALENARLLEQTHKRAVELETVSEVSAATTTLLDSDRLLQAVVDLTKQRFGLYHAHIYRYLPSLAELRLAAGADEVGREMVAEGWRIRFENEYSIVARAARTREPVVVNNVHEEAGFLPNPRLPETRSELAVPLIAGDVLLGVLDVQSDREGGFGPDDVQVQQSLAAQIAVALQNANLYETQLETATKLREVDRLKSEFLASMSHELRTPLNSIIGFADVILEGLDGDLTERMEEDVVLIRNSGAICAISLATFSICPRLSPGRWICNFDLLDPRRVVEEVMANAEKFAVTYDRRHLTLETEIAGDPGTIEADRTRLTQILYNLVSNAIKFTEEGGVYMRVERDSDRLYVSVRDTGIGIETTDLDLIFEQFRQVDGSLTRMSGGTGLGLPITRHLVELHGGRISVDSVAGEGTSFDFWIPVRRPSLAGAPQTAELGEPQ